MTKITDERLVELIKDNQDESGRAEAWGSEVVSIATELQSLRAQGGVRVEDVLDAAHEYATSQYGWGFLGNPVDRSRILSSLEASPAPVSEVSGQDLQLLDRLKRDNVWDGSRPVLERPRTDPDTEQAFRLSEQGYIALEQVALGIRLHITRKGVSALDAALAAKGGK